MTIEKISLRDKFNCFDDHWSPKVVGRVNDVHIKLVKFKGEFIWHHHDDEDELFLVVKGQMLMKLPDQTLCVKEGELIIIPKGVDHCPVALTEEVQVLLMEPNTTLNTGNVTNERTLRILDNI